MGEEDVLKALQGKPFAIGLKSRANYSDFGVAIGKKEMGASKRQELRRASVGAFVIVPYRFGKFFIRRRHSKSIDLLPNPFRN